MATITKFEDLFSNSIAWWKCDDASGQPLVVDSIAGNNGAHKTGGGSSNVVSVAGKINEALAFDNGSDMWVDMGNLTALIAGPKSIAFWVKPDNVGDAMAFLTLDGFSEYVWIDAGTTLKATGLTSPIFYVNGVVSTTMTKAQWNFVVVTTATVMTPDGFSLGSSSFSLQGDIDNVMLFDRVLTAYEISNLYLEREFLEYEIGESRIGNSHLAVIQDLDKIDRPYTLVCSYTSDLLDINLNYSKQAVLGGVPLSVSLINSNQSDPSLSINNMYYVFNIIENDEPLVSETNIFTDPANTTFSFDGTRLSAVQKNNNRYYIEIAKKDINISNSSIENSVTLAGVEMPLGTSNELIMHNTSLAMNDIQGLVNIMIGGVPLIAGRVGNEYYLIVSPIENIG